MKDSLAILDVGHGSSAVLFDSHGVVVVDTGPGSALLEFLTQHGVSVIDVVLISHADIDHIGGLVGILASDLFRIGVVRLNTDSEKASNAWDDLVYELDRLSSRGKIDFEPTLTQANSGEFDRGGIHVEVLAPSRYLASRGPGSVDRKRRRLTANSMSAIIRLTRDSKPIAVFSGDVDDVGLQNAIETGVDLRAPVVVFPHHGGRPGRAKPEKFAAKVCRAFSPEIVVFSIGRGRHGTPRAEIVRAVISYDSDIRIICSQLSEHCAKVVPASAPSHLSDSYAHGRSENRCCAGTILVSTVDGSVVPEEDAHQQFIRDHAPSALCRRAID